MYCTYSMSIYCSAVYNQLCRPITSKERARLLDTVSTTLKTLCSIPVNKDFSLSLYSVIDYCFVFILLVIIHFIGPPAFVLSK